MINQHGNLEHCKECRNAFICSDQGKCMNLFNQRLESRSILNQLSVGERLMLMFGRGELKHDPLRVEWKQPEAFTGCNTCLNLAECHKSGYCVEQMAKQNETHEN